MPAMPPIEAARQIGEGKEALLFDRDGEMLVKVVSPAQAARASTWRIGDIVQVDEREEHDPQQDRPTSHER